MKLKKLSIFLSIIVILCFDPLSESAQAISLLDLSAFGVTPMKVSRGDAVVVDGRISNEEYGEGAIAAEEKGLYFLNNNIYQKSNGSSGVMQENFVLLSGNYVYCAFRLSLPLERGNVSSVIQNGVPCYRVSISIGIADGDHPILKGSLLSNTYYFSSHDLSCVGFTGERIARSVNEPSVISKPLSTFSDSYRENGIVSADGSKWNAEFYCKNAAFSLQETASGTYLVVEVKIPLEDVLLSVLPAHRKSVEASLKRTSQSLCGNFSTSIDMDANSCIVTGVPSQLSIPDSANAQTLFDWMKNDFETPLSGVYVPKVVPIPLYWAGFPSVKDDAAVVFQEEVPITTTVPHTNVLTSSDRQDTSKVSIPSVTVTGSVSQEEGAAVENDESIFDSLPDADAKLPEDTEIIYDEKTSSSKKNEEENSLASTILATVTGAFLFASVMVLCIYFRDSGKENEKKQPDKNKRKKKNNSRNKDGRRD